MCRSVVEAKKFEFYGIRPKRAKKEKVEKITPQLCEAPITSCQPPKPNITQLCDELNLTDVPIIYDFNI